MLRHFMLAARFPWRINRNRQIHRHYSRSLLYWGLKSLTTDSFTIERRASLLGFMTIYAKMLSKESWFNRLKANAWHWAPRSDLELPAYDTIFRNICAIGMSSNSSKIGRTLFKSCAQLHLLARMSGTRSTRRSVEWCGACQPLHAVGTPHYPSAAAAWRRKAWPSGAHCSYSCWREGGGRAQPIVTSHCVY